MNTSNEKEIISNFLDNFENEFELKGSYYVLTNDPNVVMNINPSSESFNLSIHGTSSFKGNIFEAFSIKSAVILLDDFLPLPDVAEEIAPQDAENLLTQYGDALPVKAIHNDQTVYIISKETYNYFAAKCFKHEVHDAHLLGASEKYVKKVEVKLPGI